MRHHKLPRRCISLTVQETCIHMYMQPGHVTYTVEFFKNFSHYKCYNDYLGVQPTSHSHVIAHEILLLIMLLLFM